MEGEVCLFLPGTGSPSLLCPVSCQPDFPFSRETHFFHFLRLSAPDIFLQEGTQDLDYPLVPNNADKGGEIRIKKQYREI
jgi:hypothetical protein